MLADQRIVLLAHGPGCLDQSGRGGEPYAPTTAADGCPLIHEGGEGHRPSTVDVAQQVGVGYPDIGEEDLVERGTPCHLAQRPHFDAGGVHVDDEAGQSTVLR
jgi:hypothetical protein